MQKAATLLTSTSNQSIIILNLTPLAPEISKLPLNTHLKIIDLVNKQISRKLKSQDKMYNLWVNKIEKEQDTLHQKRFEYPRRGALVWRQAIGEPFYPSVLRRHRAYRSQGSAVKYAGIGRTLQNRDLGALWTISNRRRVR